MLRSAVFQVDRPENRLRPLKRRTFSELKLREHDHLQEWLADMPEALGEDLLVIQKEFAGFEGTNERLDLLALDKAGQLVIIENKLDDSGRDVVWQAIKYAAYCSSLKNADIVNIFQQYLDRYRRGSKATELICDFLNKGELDSVVLNPRNKQRVMFVAANFRKEVTSTVMWLLGHGVQAQCFRVVPYTFHDELFLDLQLIIPTPEAKDFMIKMATKETEEKASQGTQQLRDELHLEFWQQVLEALCERDLSRYQNVKPTTRSYLLCPTGVPGCSYSLNFLIGKSEARVELVLERPLKCQNKFFYDRLYQQRNKIQEAFGADLDWQRKDEAKKSSVQLAKTFDCGNTETWPEIIDWLGNNAENLHNTFAKRLKALELQLKSGEAAG